MSDSDDDTSYPPNRDDSNNQPGFSQKITIRSPPFSRLVSRENVDDYDDEVEDSEEDEIDLEGEEEEDDRNQMDGGQHVDKYMDVEEDDNEEDDEDAGGDEDEDDDGDKDDDDAKQKSYGGINDDDDDTERHPKKRKLKSLVSSYEFAPRVPAPSAAAPSAPKISSGGRNSLTDWTERETFALLDAWGERFLHRGKKSLRSEEWQEVAEKVSEVSAIERTETQCRNRLDTLKKKYKKEKMKSADVGGSTSKWVYFKKMDMLLSSPSQQGGLSCGLDGGEYMFMNSKVYLNRANGCDELRDSSGDSESTGGEENESDGLPPKKRKSGRDRVERSSLKLLADSIEKFSEVYESIEDTRRQQMVEIERMRMDMRRQLEQQKRQIMERAQAEIARLQGDDDENGGSAQNGSG